MNNDTQPLMDYPAKADEMTLEAWELELPPHVFEAVIAALNSVSREKRALALRWMEALFNNPTMSMPEKQATLTAILLPEGRDEFSLDGFTGYKVPEEAPYQAWDKPLTKEQYHEVMKPLTREELINHPLVQAFKKAAEPKPHKHGPFAFIMNQNHNALRGCQSCGAAWVGTMAGSEDNLFWHPVQELPEEE